MDDLSEPLHMYTALLSCLFLFVFVFSHIKNKKIRSQDSEKNEDIICIFDLFVSL